MIRRVLLGTALLAAVATCVVVANFRQDTESLDVDWRIKRRLPTKVVQLAQVTRAEIIQTVTAPGAIELIEEADIASEVIGKVKKVLVKKGDVVKMDDLLVQLDDEDARARFESTEARIERLRAAIDLAKLDLAKAERDSAGYQELAERGFSTPNEVRDGATTVAKRKANLDMSEQELKESFAVRRTSEKDLERTEIRAPIDGTVTDLNVEIGEVVIAGTTNLPGTVLMRIGDMNGVRVRADVDESDVGLIHSGQSVRIYLQANQREPVPGTVDRISPKGRKLSEVVSFETLINVEGGKDIVRPEMTATVEIEVKRVADALSLPVQAVVHRRLKDLPDTQLFKDWIARQPKMPTSKKRAGQTQYVKVVFVVENGEARARPVETGISDPLRIEILSGVDPDDQVIVGPFRTLDEMQEQQPVEKEEPEKGSESATMSREQA
jgi:HlyD family secretion protein